MAIGENFLLCLNEFGSNVKTFWKELEAENDFCDVTLACEVRQFETHKVVISSFSPVFGNILKLNQNPHPLIYLRRVKNRDLQNLLTFMYQGEVNVDEEDLPSFLEVAGDLLIRGLSEGNKEDCNSKRGEPPENYSQNIEPSLKRKRSVNQDDISIEPSTDPPQTIDPSTVSLQTIDDFIGNENQNEASHLFKESQTKLCKKEKNGGIDQSLISVTEQKYFMCVKCDKQFTHRNALFKHNSSVHEGVRYDCDKCDHKSTRQDSLKRHKESVHQGLTVTCDKCDKKFSNKANLWKHNSTVHEGVRYPCDHCDYKATQSANLLQHNLSQHKNKLTS